MNVGNTFVWCPPGTVTNHLWIVVTDPAANGGKCLVVNLTESLHGAHALTLLKGQHPYIYKDSDVNFGDAFQTTEGHLLSKVASGEAVPHDDMSPAIMAQIILRFRTHPAVAPILKKLLPPQPPSAT